MSAPAAPAAACPRARGAAAAYAFLALATALWSGNFVVGRAVHGRVPPVGLAFWRWAVALALLVPLARRPLAAQWRTLLRAWRVVVPLGILGVGNFNLFVYLGLTRTTATSALLLQSACPAFIAALSPLLGGGRPGRRQLAGIAVSLAGVLVILGRGTRAALGALAFGPGDLWVLAAVLSWAIYTLLLARRPAGVDPLALLTALVAVGVAWIAPFYGWELASGARLALDGVTVASVAYVAVFASVVAYRLWNEGVARVGANRAGPFIHLMPAFGSLLSVALLGEAFRPFHAAGLALVLAGVTLAGTGAPRRAGA